MLHAAERERLGRDLPRFTREAWEVIEPGTEFIPGWHIDLISEYLTAITAGEITRLIVNIPPRYMKSISVSVMWPVWSWCTNPQLRFMFSSYAQSLATKHSVDRRTIIQSLWFQERWGSVFQLTDDQNVKTEFQNDRRGVMIATSFKGHATGKGGDVIVIDDPLDPEQAHSVVERERINRTFDQKFSTRLDNKERGAIVVVMQRLHEDDLTGHLLAKGGWEHLCLAAVSEAHERVPFPIDKEREVIRLPGQVLWPEREPAQLVDRMRTELGSYAFASQYQQRPAPLEGGIIKRAHWRYFDPEMVEGSWNLATPHRVVTFWDTALRAKTQNDYTAASVWAFVGAHRYMLRAVRGRWSLPEINREVESLASWVERRFPNVPHNVLVENTANGPEVVAQLRSRVSGLMPVSVEGDKTTRVHAVTPLLEAGQVYLPGHGLADGTGCDPARTPENVQEFIEECANFPNAVHDDWVDTFTGALLRYREDSTTPNLPSVSEDEPVLDAAITAGLDSMVF